MEIKDTDERMKAREEKWAKEEREGDEMAAVLAILKQTGMAYQPRQVAQYAMKVVKALRIEQGA